MIIQKTYFTSLINRRYIIINAKNQILGRFISKIIKLLNGKNKTIFSPHANLGDKIIIINAQKIKILESKIKNKKYYSNSKTPGNLKIKTFSFLFSKNPAKILEIAIKGMLSKKKLGKKQYKNIKIYNNNLQLDNSQIINY